MSLMFEYSSLINIIMLILILCFICAFPAYNGSAISVKHNDYSCVYDNIEEVFKLVETINATRHSQVYFHSNEQDLYVKINDMTWFLGYKKNFKGNPLQVTFEKREDSCTVTLGNGTYLAAYKPYYSNGDLLPQLDYYFLGHDPNSHIVQWYPEKSLEENNDIITWKLPYDELWKVVLHFEYLYPYATQNDSYENVTPRTKLYYNPDYGVSLACHPKLCENTLLEFKDNRWHLDGKWISISPTHRVGSDRKRVTLVLVAFVKYSDPTEFKFSNNTLFCESDQSKYQLVSLSDGDYSYLTLLDITARDDL